MCPCRRGRARAAAATMLLCTVRFINPRPRISICPDDRGIGRGTESGGYPADPAPGMGEITLNDPPIPADPSRTHRDDVIGGGAPAAPGFGVAEHPVFVVDPSGQVVFSHVTPVRMANSRLAPVRSALVRFALVRFANAR